MHEQSPAQLGDHEVLVDAALVPLIEALHRRGITTIYSCQDTEPPQGRWRDDPHKARFYLCFPDVEELRRLIPLLERSRELATSIRPSLGAPRWEYLLNPRGGNPAIDVDPGQLRLQVSVFIPVEQIDLIVQVLDADSMSNRSQD